MPQRSPTRPAVDETRSLAVQPATGAAAAQATDPAPGVWAADHSRTRVAEAATVSARSPGTGRIHRLRSRTLPCGSGISSTLPSATAGPRRRPPAVRRLVIAAGRHPEDVLFLDYS